MTFSNDSIACSLREVKRKYTKFADLFRHLSHSWTSKRFSRGCGRRQVGSAAWSFGACRHRREAREMPHIAAVRAFLQRWSRNEEGAPLCRRARPRNRNRTAAKHSTGGLSPIKECIIKYDAKLQRSSALLELCLAEAALAERERLGRRKRLRKLDLPLNKIPSRHAWKPGRPGREIAWPIDGRRGLEEAEQFRGSDARLRRPGTRPRT